jgi:hypothetical protein
MSSRQFLFKASRLRNGPTNSNAAAGSAQTAGPKNHTAREIRAKCRSMPPQPYERLLTRGEARFEGSARQQVNLG